MKKYSLIFGFLLAIEIIYAQSSTIDWIIQNNSTREAIGRSVTTDENFVYTTGTFSDTCFIGDNFLISNGSNGSNDFYISKYDKEGNFVWVKSFGGSDYDVAVQILYKDGHIFTTGSFKDTVAFEDTTLISKGKADAFLMDMDVNGNLNWIKQIGGPGNEGGYAITPDGENNIYLTGIFQDTLNFDGILLVSRGDYDIFIAKLDNTGNTIWVNQAGGTGEDLGISITKDSFENIYVTGSYEDTATFGDTTVSSLGYQDIFVAKYSTSGELVWLNSFGGDWGDRGHSIIKDNADNLYFSGIFGGTAFFGNDSVVSNGWFDVFVSKFKVSGELQWIKTFGSTEIDNSYSMVSDNEYVYLSCFFEEETIIEDTLLPRASAQLFQFSNSGILTDKIQIGQYYNNHCAIDNKSALFITGANHGSQVFGDTILSSSGMDIFLTRINYKHTGVEELKKKEFVNAYPNPVTKGKVNFAFENTEHHRNMELRIYNIFGIEVSRQNVYRSQQATEMDITSWPAGIYLAVVFIDGDAVGSVKFVVE
jgi:hypothetical protein